MISMCTPPPLSHKVNVARLYFIQEKRKNERKKDEEEEEYNIVMCAHLIHYNYQAKGTCT